MWLCVAVVRPCCGDEGQIEPFCLPCKVTFSSPRPVSFAQNVRFKFPGCKTPFQLMVTATADNCLMTCYPFLALHRTDHQIVCEQVPHVYTFQIVLCKKEDIVKKIR